MSNERPTRADEVRQERRMKPGTLEQTGVRLGVDETKLDRSTYAYRWANDKGDRVQRLHAQDWDPAPETGVKADSDGEGTLAAKVAGTEDGKPFKAILMRKRKDWFKEDRKAKQRPVDEIEDAIRHGLNHQKDSPELAGRAYTPGGQNQVSRGR